MHKLQLVFILMGITFGAFSQSTDSLTSARVQIDTFATQLDSLRKSKHIPGLAAIILKDHKVVWQEGYGASHFDTGDGTVYRQVTPRTPFWIASVTKTFMGLLFLQLEEEGRLSLDDQINDIPNWDGFCRWLANSKIIFGSDLDCDKPITIKNILNHTVNGEPGNHFFYNPIMYSRLSRYIEYLYKNPIDKAEQGHNKLAELIQEKILGPANMTRTMSSQWQADKAQVFFDMATGYKYVDKHHIALIRPERHLAGGAGIVSTVADLAKYDIALDTRQLASEQLMTKLFTPTQSPDGHTLPYAFGWYIQDYRGKKLVWHAGWDEEAGFTALYLKIPQQKLTLILLANSEGMWWSNPLDKAEVHKSPFAKLFLDTFLSK